MLIWFVVVWYACPPGILSVWFNLQNLLKDDLCYPVPFLTMLTTYPGLSLQGHTLPLLVKMGENDISLPRSFYFITLFSGGQHPDQPLTFEKIFLWHSNTKLLEFPLVWWGGSFDLICSKSAFLPAWCVFMFELFLGLLCYSSLNFCGLFLGLGFRTIGGLLQYVSYLTARQTWPKLWAIILA